MGGGGEEKGVGGSVSNFFYTKNPYLKKCFGSGRGGGSGLRGWGGWSL